MFLPALWLGCFKQIPHHPHKKYIGDFQLQGSAWQWQTLLQFLKVPLTQALAPTVPSACHGLTTVLQLELYCCPPPAPPQMFSFSDAQISTSNPLPLLSLFHGVLSLLRSLSILVFPCPLYYSLKTSSLPNFPFSQAGNLFFFSPSPVPGTFLSSHRVISFLLPCPSSTRF